MMLWLLIGLALAGDSDTDAEPEPESSERPERKHEIVVEARRPSPHAVRQVLDRERVEQTPGALGDPLRVVQALPGLAVIPELSVSAGNLVIRGSSPDESRFFVEGVELPYLYHFSQYASVIHTGVLDEIAVYPSSFGPAYGNTAGGVVEAKLRSPVDDDAGGSLRGNLLMASGHAVVHQGDSDGTAFSARRSYLDLMESGSDQYTLWPVFWDYMGRQEHLYGSGSRVSFTVLGAGDGYGRYAGDTALLDPLEQESNPELQLGRHFHGGMLLGDMVIDGGRVQTTAAVIRDVWRVRLGTDSQERIETYAVTAAKALLFPASRVQLALGADLKLENLERDVQATGPSPLVQTEAPLLARGVSVNDTLRGAVGGAWVEPRLVLGSTVVQPGLRAQLQTHADEGGLLLDPRLTVQSELAKDLRLRLGGGLYSQAPDLDDVDPSTGTAGLQVTRAAHLAVGVDAVVAQRLEFNLDLWGRQIGNAVALDSEGRPSNVDGRAVGVELGSRYRLREVFFAWVSLALGRAERGGAPFDYDQPYALNTVLSWDFADGWNAGLRHRLAAGLPHTPVTGGAYDGTTDAYAPIYGTDNSARLPDYQKVDLHLEHTWTRDWGHVGVYAELWWVISGNVLEPVYSYDFSQAGQVGGPPFLPLIGARIGR
jgi:hypothetical protein